MPGLIQADRHDVTVGCHQRNAIPQVARDLPIYHPVFKFARFPAHTFRTEAIAGAPRPQANSAARLEYNALSGAGCTRRALD